MNETQIHHYTPESDRQSAEQTAAEEQIVKKRPHQATVQYQMSMTTVVKWNELHFELLQHIPYPPDSSQRLSTSQISKRWSKEKDLAATPKSLQKLRPILSPNVNRSTENVEIVENIGIFKIKSCYFISHRTNLLSHVVHSFKDNNRFYFQMSGILLTYQFVVMQINSFDIPEPEIILNQCKVSVFMGNKHSISWSRKKLVFKGIPCTN